MDPISLIIAALVAGAAAGLKDSASAAIKDTYEGLKGLIRRRLGAHPEAEAELERVERQPDDAGQAALYERLQAASADRDEQLVRAAQAVLKQVDPVGAQAGKYNVQITGGKGIAIGDAQIVTMNFNDDG